MDMYDIDLQEFTKVLDSCKGDVFMVTADGDRLNLKSKLCQLIGFSKLLEGGTLTSARIECTDKEDESKLFRFNVFGNEKE